MSETKFDTNTEFDHYLVIFTLPTLRQQFQPQKVWDQVLTAKLNVILPA
jgi:hypothetical protein